MTAAAGARPGRRILFSVNTAWNVVNFRAGLVRMLMAAGHEVTVAAPGDAHRARVEALGCRFIDLPMDAQGRSPTADLRLLARYVGLMRAGGFDLFLGFTAKPNIYGSLAAGLYGVPVINNIAGLGMIFNERGATSRIIRMLYRRALRRSATVFFQNPSDRALFVAEGLVDARLSEVLPGSGVDLARFRPPPPAPSRRRVFLLVARLLREKGVAELVEAARRLRDEGTPVTVRLLGPVAAGNPAFVQQAQLRAWEAEGLATWLGETDDVRPHLAAADCVVLPSYYPEGTPRALLEAAAMARPIITCDLPGCRDAVEHGVSGFLVRPRDVDDLAAHIRRMSALPDDELSAMGAAGRARVERMFDERIVLDRYAAAIAALPVSRHS